MSDLFSDAAEAAALPILHPALWRASELAQAAGSTIATGYPALSAALPGGGWPTGNLIDLLLPQAGIGELRLLRPALRQLGAGPGPGPIVLLQPPHVPHVQALDGIDVPASQLIWIRNAAGNDGLWAAEQILRSGSCAALLFWQQHVRGNALRRLHLAAQSAATLFCMLRPLAVAADASPAVLRLSLHAAAGGLEIGFVKRRGPRRDSRLFLPLHPSPVSLHHHAFVDRPAFAATSAGSVLSDLVG
jgi:protein ImuA